MVLDRAIGAKGSFDAAKAFQGIRIECLQRGPGGHKEGTVPPAEEVIDPAAAASRRLADRAFSGRQLHPVQMSAAGCIEETVCNDGLSGVICAPGVHGLIQGIRPFFLDSSCTFGRGSICHLVVIDKIAGSRPLYSSGRSRHRGRQTPRKQGQYQQQADDSLFHSFPSV